MHEVTEFHDLTNAAVIGWNAAVKRACDRQPTSHPENLTAETICALTGLLPLYPFEVPDDGMVATGPMSVEVRDGAAYKRYETITVADHEAINAAERAAAEAETVAQFQRDAYALSDDLAAAYAAFMAAFEQAVGAAMMAGAQLDATAVTYQSLVSALSQLEGEQWLKIANQLTGLWNIVVVHTRKTPGEAYDMLPMLECRRQNPKQEGGE